MGYLGNNVYCAVILELFSVFLNGIGLCLLYSNIIFTLYSAPYREAVPTGSIGQSIN